MRCLKRNRTAGYRSAWENREGYISAAGNASLVEKNRQTVDSGARQRREVVEFALQFLGGEYKYGGTDPNKGVDCSGFTRYVMKYGVSVEIPHSSTGQAACGTEVSEEEMQPGDLIFYSSPLAGSTMWLCMRETGRLFMLLQKKQALSCLLIITGSL